MPSEFFTKSKFLLAIECPTKLYYHSNSDIYLNNRTTDPFIEALAKAGFQVGALAKCYYQDEHSIDLTDLNTNQALSKTKELLKKDRVIIFEAAVAFNDLLLRADILVKNGTHVRLIEVKSSVWDSNKDSIFMKKGGITQDWLRYINDVAFQKFVFNKAYPNFKISVYLGLLNKYALCPTSGLNQKFRISRTENGLTKVSGIEKLNAADLSDKLLIEINVDNEITYLSEEVKYRNDLRLGDYIEYLAKCYLDGQKLSPTPGKICANCEFRISNQKLAESQKNGFEECWREACHFQDGDFKRPSVLDIWNYARRDELIKKGVYFQDQVEENDILPKKNTSVITPGLSGWQRRLLQIERSKHNDLSFYIDRDGLASEISTWIYPLHFIDFETAAPAIPLDKGAHPYEGFAFQFSHHILYENGIVKHADQFLNNELGVNPNLSFIRALKASLSKDDGTVFRYHNHENTYLNYIHKELIESNNIDDKEVLIEFIQSIAKPTSSSGEVWETGNRLMVDLCKIVESYTFEPAINGKTSIKKVLPAILNRSSFLQKKYGQKIYGSNAEIKSLNFHEPIAWVINDGCQILDPYSLLPKLFRNIELTDDQIEWMFDNDELKEGGAASIAYMYMQFSEMSAVERQYLTDALLRYCELDTLAMVMIVEAWLNY
ncbi:TPA: DUF2779 domain-containing protein [Legionella pneumophila]|nr:DUF2779 domain-containing protein [Legionella pneumophila]